MSRLARGGIRRPARPDDPVWPLPDDPVRGEIAVKRRDPRRACCSTTLPRSARRCVQGWKVGAVRIASHSPTCDGERSVEILDATDGSGQPRRSCHPLPGRGGRAQFRHGASGRHAARTHGQRTRPAGRASDLQTHVPCPPDFGPRVQMRWFADGYGGLCPVGNGELNISLAAAPPVAIERLKRWAHAEFSLPDEPPVADHRTAGPRGQRHASAALRRQAMSSSIGDAARVVEPFTGEGIYYALRSGELAAAAIVAAARGGGRPDPPPQEEYGQAHAAMYRGRLWVNRLARAAGRHPRLASWALEGLRWQPGVIALPDGEGGAVRGAPALAAKTVGLPPGLPP